MANIAIRKNQVKRRRALPWSQYFSQWLSILLVLIFLLFALFPQMFSLHEPARQNLRQRLQPPVWQSEGNWEHPLGTDHLGRDIWSRIVHGARISLVVAAGAVVVAGLLGTVLGIVAGYFGGRLDEVIMRLADIQLSFPPILLVIAIMAVIGSSLINIILVLGLVSWVQYARVVRAETIVVREQAYVEAAQALGGTNLRIIWRHAFPQLVPTLLVIAAVNASQQILNEAALSFLGLGVQPPTPAWGSMLHEGQSYFHVAWWNAVFPGLAIFLLVLGVNVIGDTLSDRR
jgi:peptide/nickel transport system permease protein